MTHSSHMYMETKIPGSEHWWIQCVVCLCGKVCAMFWILFFIFMVWLLEFSSALLLVRMKFRCTCLESLWSWQCSRLYRDLLPWDHTEKFTEWRVASRQRDASVGDGNISLWAGMDGILLIFIAKWFCSKVTTTEANFCGKKGQCLKLMNLEPWCALNCTFWSSLIPFLSDSCRRRTTSCRCLFSSSRGGWCQSWCGPWRNSWGVSLMGVHGSQTMDVMCSQAPGEVHPFFCCASNTQCLMPW